MRDALRGVDWIIPLTAIVGAPACAAAGFFRSLAANTRTIQLLMDMRRTGQRVLFPNTNSGYGTTPPGTVCTEDTPLQPISIYGRTKMGAERLVRKAEDTVVFRFATLFGVSARMRTDLLVNDFVLRAVRDRGVVLYEPHFRRNYLHVRDAAATFLHAMQNWNALEDGVYNVGLPDALTKRQLCEAIRDVVPDFQICEAPIGADVDRRDYDVSNAKIRGTGWVPQFSLRDGIAELVKAYRTLPPGDYTNA